MPNIILQREAVPELVGLKCTPRRIEESVTALLEDEEVRLKMFNDYCEICRALGSDLALSATERTAEMVEEMVAEAETIGVARKSRAGTIVPQRTAAYAAGELTS
jgi:lipid A disaccharide synthetase